MKYFPEYCESFQDGETIKALSKSAKENKIYLIGGSIPEKDGDKLYNTCPVFDPEGNLIARHRKVTSNLSVSQLNDLCLYSH